MNMHRMSIAVGAAVLWTGLAFAQSAAPAKVGDTAKGKALVDQNGMSLYTFDRDAPGKSNCTGLCATSWPPLAATSDTGATGDWSVVTRADGTKQWAYKGKPLYHWKDDKKAGDATGDGFNNVWHLAQP